MVEGNFPGVVPVIEHEYKEVLGPNSYHFSKLEILLLTINHHVIQFLEIEQSANDSYCQLNYHHRSWWLPSCVHRSYAAKATQNNLTDSSYSSSSFALVDTRKNLQDRERIIELQTVQDRTLFILKAFK